MTLKSDPLAQTYARYWTGSSMTPPPLSMVTCVFGCKLGYQLANLRLMVFSRLALVHPFWGSTFCLVASWWFYILRVNRPAMLLPIISWPQTAVSPISMGQSSLRENFHKTHGTPKQLHGKTIEPYTCSEQSLRILMWNASDVQKHQQ